MSEDLVSVVIPTFNREETIARAVNSVLNQTYKNIEVIVVDDCSKDSTAKIVQSIKDSRLKYYRLETNGGACIARNYGIDIARGKYIAFQDSDDEWLPEKLGRQIETICERNADVCFHGLRRFVENNHEIRSFPSLERSGFVSIKQLCTSSCVSTQTIVAKRKVFDEVLFDQNVKRFQDYDWTLRASRLFSFYYLNELLVNQYYQNNSISTARLDVVIETREYFIDKYKDTICAELPEFEARQLYSIAACKAVLGWDASHEYKRICTLRGSKSDYARHLLSRLGLIGKYYRLKGLRNSSMPK